MLIVSDAHGQAPTAGPAPDGTADTRTTPGRAASGQSVTQRLWRQRFSSKAPAPSLTKGLPPRALSRV